MGCVLERQQQARDIPQGRALNPPLAQRAIGASAKTDEDKILTGVQELFQTQVVMQADSGGWHPPLGNRPEEAPDLLFLIEQLARFFLGRGRQIGETLPQELNSLRGQAEHTV